MSKLPPELVQAGERLLAYCEGRDPSAKLLPRWRDGPFPNKAAALRRLLNEDDPPLVAAWWNLAAKDDQCWLDVLDILSDLPDRFDEQLAEAGKEHARLAKQIADHAEILIKLQAQARSNADDHGFEIPFGVADPLQLMHEAGIETDPPVVEGLEPRPPIPKPGQTDDIYPDMSEILKVMAEKWAQSALAPEHRRQKPGKASAVKLFDQRLETSFARTARDAGLRERWRNYRRNRKALDPKHLANDHATTAALLNAAFGRIDFTAEDARNSRR